MFDVNQAPDVLFSIVALVFPVLGVILLLLAAHIVGGALKPRGRNSRQGELPRSVHSTGSQSAGNRAVSRHEERLPHKSQV